MALLSLNGTNPGNWTVLADGETPSEGDDVAVPFVRFTSESEEFFSTAGSVGAIISPDTAYTDLAPLVNKLAFVAIDFPVFGDGRGFSLAVRLRKDLGFKGEIRAVGNAIPDQALFLLRSGFDTAEVADERKDAFETALARFTSFYQTDFQGRTSVAHARHSAEAKPEQRKAS